MKTIIGWIVGIIVLLFFVGLVVPYAIDKQEIATCLKLQEQSKKYKPHFYLTPYQRGVCNKHEIAIDAPVRTSSEGGAWVQ